MDIFNTVASAIDLTEKIWKTIDNFQKVPKRMRRLQFDVKSLQQLMYKLQTIQFESKEQEELIKTEVEEVEKTLGSLQNKIDHQKQKPIPGMFSRSLRTFKTQLKFDDMEEMADELQKRKASLSLTINMLVFKYVDNMNQRMQQHATATMTMTKSNETTDLRQTQIPMKKVPHIAKNEFLNRLEAPNYVEDELRVKAPAEGTAVWIYGKEAYQRWKDADGLSSLHLVGKMGSGKSVLAKNILIDLKREQAESCEQNVVILYYFCSCVNRTDSPSNILKGFISQLVLEREQIYDTITGTNDLLQFYKSRNNNEWSFEALWHIFSLVSLLIVGTPTADCISWEMFKRRF